MSKMTAQELEKTLRDLVDPEVDAAQVDALHRQSMERITAGSPSIPPATIWPLAAALAMLFGGLAYWHAASTPEPVSENAWLAANPNVEALPIFSFNTTTTTIPDASPRSDAPTLWSYHQSLSQLDARLERDRHTLLRPAPSHCNPNGG